MSTQSLKQFIKTSRLIDEEQKTKYLQFFDGIKDGKLDLETAAEIDEYLFDEVKQLEDTAIASRDTVMINALADMRNAQLDFQRQFMGMS
ncbi:MAG: hypothetical protein PVJ09_00845 [Candidatus Woesebacteria bacterium]|jgi:hypothetical protein